VLPQAFPVPADNSLIKNLPVVSILDNHLLQYKLTKAFLMVYFTGDSLH